MNFETGKTYSMRGEDLNLFVREAALMVQDQQAEAFDLGFAAGATQASDDYEAEIPAILERRTECAYGDGFTDATSEISDAQMESFNEGYDAGFSDGQGGMDEELSSARTDGYADGYEDGFNSGFDVGYEEARLDMIDAL